MNNTYRLLSFVLAVGLLNCTSVRVSQDYDLSRGFTAIGDYGWRISATEKTGDPRVNDPLTASRVQAAVESVLAERGFRKTTGATPDFYADYNYDIHSRIASNEPRTGIGFGFGHFGRHGGVGAHTGSSVEQYDEGLLVIDFIDAVTGNLMWRGTGTHRFMTHTRPEKRAEIITELVTKILSQFPPG
ncbi:MAG: DUF4136 domain-containing protein [Desulfobacteraceae bacterium]|nr:DUF4136 domain-containing protein [Desulfobacteraceae bacterium]